MKHLFTSLSFFLLCLTANAQTPFTITAANFPLFGVQNFDKNTTAISFTPAANGTWDESAYHTGVAATNQYVVETDPYYTSAGIDVYINDFKNLTPALGYYVYYEYDFNATSVEEKGIYVPEQHYGLGSFSGSATDSMIFPLQGSIFPTGRRLMQFPATYQTGWHSQSRRSVDFTMTVGAAGLNKTPGKHVFTVFRNDSIVGWGKMRVYTAAGPSVYYDVLMDRSVQYSVDSFYLGGAPAPAQLLSVFGVTQGQQTGLNNRYAFYRQGNSTSLAIVNYGSNAFQTPTGTFFDEDNLITTGIDELKDGYTTLLYPNPVNGGEINIQITGKELSLEQYFISDMQGRMVQSGTVDLTNGSIRLQLNNQMANGSYVVRITDSKKQTLISEQFMVER
jgi:hypothetical protein